MDPENWIAHKNVLNNTQEWKTCTVRMNELSGGSHIQGFAYTNVLSLWEYNTPSHGNGIDSLFGPKNTIAHGREWDLRDKDCYLTSGVTW